MPVSTALMVAGVLLLMTGVPLLTASMSEPALPALRVQAYLLALASSKSSLPIVIAPSRVTVVLAVIVRVLKSAVLPDPAATTLFDQLAAFVIQEPPAKFVHTPEDAASAV